MKKRRKIKGKQISTRGVMTHSSISALRTPNQEKPSRKSFLGKIATRTGCSQSRRITEMDIYSATLEQLIVELSRETDPVLRAIIKTLIEVKQCTPLT